MIFAEDPAPLPEWLILIVVGAGSSVYRSSRLRADTAKARILLLGDAFVGAVVGFGGASLVNTILIRHGYGAPLATQMVAALLFGFASVVIWESLGGAVESLAKSLGIRIQRKGEEKMKEIAGEDSDSKVLSEHS